jgi:hypothetical protein
MSYHTSTSKQRSGFTPLKALMGAAESWKEQHVQNKREKAEAEQGTALGVPEPSGNSAKTHSLVTWLHGGLVR